MSTTDRPGREAEMLRLIERRAVGEVRARVASHADQPEWKAQEGVFAHFGRTLR